jgi:hypothetical protein
MWPYTFYYRGKSSKSLHFLFSGLNPTLLKSKTSMSVNDVVVQQPLYFKPCDWSRNYIFLLRDLRPIRNSTEHSIGLAATARMTRWCAILFGNSQSRSTIDHVMMWATTARLPWIWESYIEIEGAGRVRGYRIIIVLLTNKYFLK